MEEKFYNYFKLKLGAISDLMKYQSSINNPAFEKWWGSITATCERMGPRYKQRADRINFFPSVLTSGDDSEWINQTYTSGLNQAEAFIETLMEELQTWGLDDSNNKKFTEKNKTNVEQSPYNLYVTVNQQQAQQIIQTINLDKYDNETKEKVELLFSELSKLNKNKSKISNIVKWLANKSIDALIAILIAKANLQQ